MKQMAKVKANSQRPKQQRAITQQQMISVLRRAAANPNLSPGSADRRLSAPAAVGAECRSMLEFAPSKFRAKYRDSVCIRGREWLGPVTVPANAPAGTPLRNDYVQPGSLLGTRIAQFGQLYEKFLFTKLNLRYTPAVGSSQAGSIVLAYDRDISDPTPPATLQGVREYMSWQDSVQGNVWLPHVLQSKLESPETGFYTDDSNGGDERLAYQGQLYVAVADPLGNVSHVTIGSVSIEYELHLFIPQLQSLILTAAASNPATTLPTAVDALRQYGSTAAGVVISAAANAGWLPKGQTAAASTAAIRVAEGLYRLYNQVAAAGAGNLTFGPPVITPLDPPYSVQAQPQVRVITSQATAAAGDVAVSDSLISVPKGGGDIYQAFSTFTATPGASKFNLVRLGDYLPDISAANVF